MRPNKALLIFSSNAVIATGVLLSLIQFFSNRSLWLDEAYLALNFIEKSPIQLMQPLANNQVAPPLFLLIEKAFFTIIPYPDQALRLFPLLSYWAALYFFSQLSRTFFHQSSSHLISVSLFALSSTILYYSCEVKQYMTDVAVLCTMYFIATREFAIPKKKYFWLLFCGSMAIFLSNIGILILFTIGLYLLTSIQKKSEFTWLFLTGGIWVLFFGINYYFFIAGHPTRAFMLKYWSRENAFMPINIWSMKFVYFITEQATDIFNNILLQSKVFAKTGLVAFFAAGLVFVFRKKPFSHNVWIFFLPIPLHLMLSAFQLYPFEARLILYTAPLIILLIGFGWESLLLKMTEHQNLKMQYVAFLFPLISLSGLFFDGFPLQKQEVKENIAYYNEHAQPNQGLYLSLGAKHIASYYQKTNFLKPKGVLTVSKVKRIQKKYDHKKILEEICKLQGQHWLLLNNGYLDKVALIEKSLDSMHIPKLDAHFTKKSSLYLFDFGSGCQRR